MFTARTLYIFLVAFFSGLGTSSFLQYREVEHQNYIWIGLFFFGVAAAMLVAAPYIRKTLNDE